MPDAATSVPSPPRASWYRRLYARVEALSSTRYALVALLVISVIDGSVFPVPPFAVLIPMILAKPKRWWRLALMGTLASLVGGLIGYGLGVLIHQGLLHALSVDLNAPITRFGINSSVGELLGKNFWVLALLCSVLPTPFKVVAIGSGVVSVPVSRFLLAAVIGRTVRFFGIAAATVFVRPKTPGQPVSPAP